MSKENALINDEQNLEEDLYEGFDLDVLEEKLQEEFADLEFLEKEREQIGNPDKLGEVIKDIVWEQFVNQIGISAGEEFINKNNGLTLDLSKDAHIQTAQNFDNGKIATHNTKTDYQKRYDDWQKNFQTNPDTAHDSSNYRYNESKGVWEKYDSRSGSYKRVLEKDARKDFDKDRPKGSANSQTDMDHIIPAAEIIRDPAANAFLTKEEQVAFANGDKNLNEMEKAPNQSKSDSTMNEWLDSERDGKKPAERFNIDEDELRQKDKEARDEYEKIKNEAEEKAIKEGKQSRKEEAFRIGGQAIKAVVMQLLADLVKEIIAELVKWFKSKVKSLETLLESLKEAIHSFIGKMKEHLLNAGNTVFNTIASAIIGPVFNTIKKVWMLLKQGWNSLKEAVKYLRDPANKGKPIGLLLLETGVIIISGLTATGAILLGEVIEKGLSTIPILAFEIPFLGSLANILGVFLGAVVAGIIGAIAINLINKKIEKQQKAENLEAAIQKKNEILNTQNLIYDVSRANLEENIKTTVSTIKNRHEEAAGQMKKSLGEISANSKEDESILSTLDDIDVLLKELEG